MEDLVCYRLIIVDTEQYFSASLFILDRPHWIFWPAGNTSLMFVPDFGSITEEGP